MSKLRVDQSIYDGENISISGEHVYFMGSSNEKIERDLHSTPGKTILFELDGHLLIVKIDRDDPTRFYTVTTSVVNPGKTKYWTMGMITYTTLSGSKYTFVKKGRSATAVIDLYAKECRNVFGLCKVKNVGII